MIVLLNMVTPEEVDESLAEEVYQECSNYGQVIVRQYTLVKPA
jgi:hypothetical protein